MQEISNFVGAKLATTDHVTSTSTSLVLKEQGTLPEQKPEKPSSGDKDSSIENKDDVKTGVESNTKGLLAFALLSGGAIVSLLKKRRKLND